MDRAVRVELVTDAGAVVAGTLTSESVEALRQALDHSPAQGRWLTGARAAGAYLGCSERRIFNRLHLIPHERDGGRLMFHTDALDAYLRDGP